MIGLVSQRDVLGGGGRVQLRGNGNGAGGAWVVVVTGPDGRLLGVIWTDDAADAIDAYRHPFARPSIASPWAAAGRQS